MSVKLCKRSRFVILIRYTRSLKSFSPLRPFRLSMCGNTFKQRTQQKRKYSDGVFSRKSVETAMITTSDDQFVEHYPCPPSQPESKAFIDDVTCSHASFFIGGKT